MDWNGPAAMADKTQWRPGVHLVVQNPKLSGLAGFSAAGQRLLASNCRFRTIHRRHHQGRGAVGRLGVNVSIQLQQRADDGELAAAGCICNGVQPVLLMSAPFFDQLICDVLALSAASINGLSPRGSER
jgi:hypothetical protein